jgi:hypothetical protein
MYGVSLGTDLNIGILLEDEVVKKTLFKYQSTY